jgi:PAS domain-containing protein
LVDADLLGAKAGARLICDVLPRPEAPLDEEARLVEVAANISGIAIEHHRTLEALRRSEERNRAILRAIPDWMFILDLNGGFVDYHAKNPADLLVPPEVFLGKAIWDVLPPVISSALATAMAGALASDEPKKFEYSLESIRRSTSESASSVVTQTGSSASSGTSATASARKWMPMSSAASSHTSVASRRWASCRALWLTS